MNHLPGYPSGIAPERSTWLDARSRRWSALIVFAAGHITASLLAQTSGAPAGESRLLERGKTIERQLSGGQAHEYHFMLRTGEFARVLAEQRSIRVALKVFGPDNKQILAGDAYDIGSPQPAELIAGAPGTYRLRISASESSAPIGSYGVTLQEVEVATARHKSRVAAVQAVARAAFLSANRTREGLLKGIASLEEALAQWRAAQDRFEEARTMYRIGLLYIDVGERQKAAEYTTQALEAARSSGDDSAIARALDSVGEVYNYFGEKRKAIEYYEQALPRFRAAGDRAGEGRTLSNLGVAYSGTGEKRKALVLFNTAVQLFRELQDRRMLAEVAGNMGVTYDNLGEYQSALDNHQYELALQRELADRASEAITLNNIGSALFRPGGIPEGSRCIHGCLGHQPLAGQPLERCDQPQQHRVGVCELGRPSACAPFLSGGARNFSRG